MGLPREIAWRGRTIFTGIWKEPVEGLGDDVIEIAQGPEAMAIADINALLYFVRADWAERALE